MKRFPFLFSLCAVLLLGFGCGDGGSDSTPAANVYQPGLAPLKLLTWRFLPQEKTLLEKFERRNRVDIEVIVKPMREIVEMAQAGNGLGADVVLLPTLEDAVRLRGFNVLQPFFVNAFTNGNIGDNYLDNEGYYAGLTRWTMTAVYNPKAVAIGEVSSYKEVAKLPLRGIRLGMAHPDSSGFATNVSGLVTALNPDAGAIWAKLMYQGSTPYPVGSDADQLDRMLAGDLDVAYVSSGNAIRWFLNGDPQHFEAAETWRFQYPKAEATGDIIPNMTTIAMPANAPNRNMALLLIDYLFDKNVQEELSSYYFEYPVHAFALPHEYLIGVNQPLTNRLSAENLEAQVGSAWSMINSVAAEQDAEIGVTIQ